MTIENRSQKTFLAVTILTVLAIVSVITAYAAYINTFSGGDVLIGGDAVGTVTYSTDNSTWNPTLSLGSAGTSWFAKINLNGGQYSGQAVTVDWQLQTMSESSWSNVGTPTQTSMTLGTGARDVYVTTSGLAAGNRDWKTDATTQGTYRVIAIVNTATS